MAKKWFTKDLERVQSLILEAKELMEAMKDTQQEKFDNLPEGFQQGTKGEAIEERISNFEEIYDNLENSMDTIELMLEG
jgi:hypothetical protein